MLIGSPRKKGNTNLLAGMLKEKIDNKIFKLNISQISDFKIKPCVDCRNCKSGDFKCTVKDGMQGLYKNIEEADVLVFGTPIYWFGPTAQMKLVIDRLRPYYQNKMLTDKKAALLLPAGSGSGDCDLTIEMFKRVFAALGIEYVGGVTAEAFEEGDVLSNSDIEINIEALAGKINLD